MNKIFSGMRPSGKLHLGNYLGAIKNWISLQDNPETAQAIYAVVDYHGITTPFDPKTYHQQVMDVILDYLAAGVNPEKSLLMRQSKVSAHTELGWIFNTITPVSWLERLPNYKEKIDQTDGKYNHMGLLDYPVLMAADILVYKANFVPVGDDQLPHIDLTNEIGRKFNHLFGETFEPVRPNLTEGARIMSLQEPNKKMSKTGDDGIALSDEPDEIRRKIKKAVTNEAGIMNLSMVYGLLAKKNPEAIERGLDNIKNKKYADFKNLLSDVIIDFLKDFREKRQELAQNMDQVEKILSTSEEKARNLANKTLTEVKEKMGL